MATLLLSVTAAPICTELLELLLKLAGGERCDNLTLHNCLDR